MNNKRIGLTAELAELRDCMVAKCGYKVPNGLTNVDHICWALKITYWQSTLFKPINEKEGFAEKSMANIPMLEELITETQYS